MTEQKQEQYVIIRVEPSKKLSALCGFPYLIEQRFTVEELLEKNVINEDDIEQMRQGIGIHKNIRVE